MNFFTWIAIIICISQSGMFSGLNLAFFSVSKLKLQIEAEQNNKAARQVLALRDDSNFLLATILWGNVSVNVLLALLSGSVLTGVAAFFFSTVLITIIGEIIPQAYFSRNAIKMAALLSPLLRFYQVVLYLVAKPTALVLDRWLGKEAIQYFREKDLRELLRIHMQTQGTDLTRVEGSGAINFLASDGLPVSVEGELIDPDSIIQLDFIDGKPHFPLITPSVDDQFLQRVNVSGKKWVILIDTTGQPVMVLDSDSLLRDALFSKMPINADWYCHRPIIIKEDYTPLGAVIPRLHVEAVHAEDDVIDEDVVLLWGKTKRIITGSDILGRLLRGIVQNENTHYEVVINKKTL
jgi:metal transporter CNNM